MKVTSHTPWELGATLIPLRGNLMSAVLWNIARKDCLEHGGAMAPNGLKCSTFDQGNAPENDDWVCCSVGDWFTGFNWGCSVMAIRFIQSRGSQPTTWRDFENWVMSKGGWLSSNLRKEVMTLWNAEGNKAWPIDWGQGIVAIGNNEDGLVWNYQGNDDFRIQLFRDVFVGLPALKV